MTSKILLLFAIAAAVLGLMKTRPNVPERFYSGVAVMFIILALAFMK